MVIDIPNIWAYLGQVIGAMIQEGDAVPMSFLKPVCAPLQPFGRAGNVAAEVLKDAITRLVSEVTSCQISFWHRKKCLVVAVFNNIVDFPSTFTRLGSSLMASCHQVDEPKLTKIYVAIWCH